MDRPIRLGAVANTERPADAEIQAVCDEVRPEFLKKTGITIKEFRALCYTRQAVAGVNYYAKISLGGGQFCHVSMYKPPPNSEEKASVTGFQLGKIEHDPIVYF